MKKIEVTALHTEKDWICLRYQAHNNFSCLELLTLLHRFLKNVNQSLQVKAVSGKSLAHWIVNFKLNSLVMQTFYVFFSDPHILSYKGIEFCLY